MLALEEGAIATETFGQYIKRTMSEKGLNPVTCARRAFDRKGKPMKHSQWNALMEDEPKRSDGSLPERSRETAKRVALGLDIPERLVMEAAGLRTDEETDRIPGVMLVRGDGSIETPPGTSVSPTMENLLRRLLGDVEAMRREISELKEDRGKSADAE